jgi:hypothetical protein
LFLVGARQLKANRRAILQRAFKGDLDMTLQDLLLAQGLSGKDLVQELGKGE